MEEKKENNVVENNNKEQNNETHSKFYPFVYGVSFRKAFQVYYFSSDFKYFKKGDNVVVETVNGLELGTIKTYRKYIKDVKIDTPLKPIARKATEEDLAKYQENIEKAKKAEDIFVKSVNDLKLDMVLVDAEYTLDATKILFIYIADERVDFRELLKVLASKLGCRIELRQIGARDRAKTIGGLGPCGLPLCCSTFLSDFEGISINMAKNQLLALNIQKLTGQCGKLVCCLKYEDSLYSELRVGLPKMGQRCIYNNEQFKITSMNVLSKTIKLENSENIVNLTFDEYFKEAKNVAPTKLQEQ